MRHDNYSKKGNSLRYVGHGHVRGYAGLVHTAQPIAKLIPPTEMFIEPLAGLGRIAAAVGTKASKIVLNDLGAFACAHNLEKFPNAIVTQEDYIKCALKWDASNRVEFFDPPWRLQEYKNGCRGRAICDRTPTQYYEEIFEILPKLKCHWFVAGSKHNTKLKKSGYNYKLIEAEDGAKIMGGLIKTALISDLPLS